MSRLQGKVAIITGAAQGMGESHARMMASMGAKVIITDLQTAKGEAVARSIGSNARFFVHDVTDEAAWKRVVVEAEAAFGPVSVLVNNAGVGDVTPFEALTAMKFKKTMDINALGVFLGMKAVVPSMKRAGGGSIVNISSVAGITGAKNCLDYVASKFAVTGMTKAAALELASLNIRVNSIHPGMVVTPMLNENDTIDLSQGYMKQVLDRVPIGRPGKPAELSHLAIYLASDESTYCTGAEFTADGGLNCQQ